MIKTTEMMRVWRFSVISFNYSEYHMPLKKDVEHFQMVCMPRLSKSERIGQIWKPLVFMKKIQRKNPDFVRIAENGIAVTHNALKVLRPLIEKSVEILPLKSVGAKLYFFNVLEVLDCLDEEKTDYRLSLVTKTKVGINKYAFKPEKIIDKHIFKIKGDRFGVFISDQFRTICQHNYLQALDFDMGNIVWQK